MNPATDATKDANPDVVPAALPQCVIRVLGEPLTSTKIRRPNPTSASGPGARISPARQLALSRTQLDRNGRFLRVEPPGETHTLVVPDDAQEMITLFHITGCMIYVDPWGKQTGYEDVFTKVAMCRRHYAEMA
jgi:hypothetical protein